MQVVGGRTGRVYLVGAGPGDPELITVRGLRLLQRADVVVYDRLIDPRLLEEAPASAERIFVGKKGGHYLTAQAGINEVLIRHASAGREVVRLKGGDPFLFGRGGEEALALLEAGIPFEVVPGVSSAFAVPASGGIPVTHRGLAASVAVVTGHEAGEGGRVDWARLATAADTLVILMPLANLRAIIARLILHGRSLQTPAALIEAGTRRGQRRLVSTLRDLPAEAERSAIQSPALLVVGEVVSLAHLLPGLEVPPRFEHPATTPGETTLQVSIPLS
jgi:uroporphyrinogen III methyltransferase/synthase